MDKAEVIQIIRKQDAKVRDLGVTSLFLFGSTARGEPQPESDVDIFVDYDLDRFGFVELSRLEDLLTTALGRPAEVTTREGLHPLIRAAVEDEAVRVF